MDEEIKAALLEISKEVQGVGRSIGSRKERTEADLRYLAKALRLHAKSLDTYRKLAFEK